MLKTLIHTPIIPDLSFYILLSGQVAIYVNTEAVAEDVADDTTETNAAGQTGDLTENAEVKRQTPAQIRKATNRTKFGNHVGTLSKLNVFHSQNVTLLIVPLSYSSINSTALI